MKKTIRDYDLNEKKVLIRCDFNVPIKDGKIQDDTRIRESLKTINYAIENNAKVILLSHLGRIKSEEDLKKNDLFPVARRLAELLNREVKFSKVTRGNELEEQVSSLKVQEVLLIQNTRYEDLDGKKESSNDEELGAYWANLADIFINDAFGTVHRAHASNVGIASKKPNGIGFLIEKELQNLEQLTDPKRPFVVILGGSKVEDKIGVIDNLIEKCDKLIIGGGMAFTFLKAKDIEIGKSILDENSLDFCKKILNKYSDKIILPEDVEVTEEFIEEAPNHLVSVGEINENEMGMDLGIKTIGKIKESLSLANTVFWNGPLGVYEMKKYRRATEEVLSYLASSSKHVVLGGGDIVAASAILGYKDKITHASTGGGATLEYLEGKALPGIACINEK